MRLLRKYRIALVAAIGGAAAGLDTALGSVNPVWHGLAVCSAVFIGAILAGAG